MKKNQAWIELYLKWRNNIMNSKILIFACLAIVTIFIGGCNSSEGGKNQEIVKDESNTVQNQKNNDNTVGNVDWPSNMPDFVPEFTYGESAGILTNRADGTQWIIVYSSVQDDASEKYAADLESKGWKIKNRGNSLAAEYGEYVISLSHMKETHAAQLNIMKP